MPSALLAVARTDDRIVLMEPTWADRPDARAHAILTEDESFCVSAALRRMAASRDLRAMTFGTSSSGLTLERVAHHRLPIEIHFDDDDGVTVIDLTRDDALAIADMTWATYRATGVFQAKTTLTGAVRRMATPQATLIPAPDAVDMGDARMVGDVARIARGGRPGAK